MRLVSSILLFSLIYSTTLLGKPKVGTQIIGPRYHFTSEHPVVEGARRILEMGSDIVKINLTSGKEFETIVDLPFQHIFIWYHDPIKWIDGVTPDEKQQVYNLTYQYVKGLILRYNNSGKSFYIGHWEGDWMLLGHYDGTKDALPIAIEGMKDWYNTRSEAIRAALKDTPHQNINIYHYAEVNRVRDAMVLNKKRLVNTVLPFINVDFVSYSAYDIQKLPEQEMFSTLEYVQDHMRNKTMEDGTPRLFIGEFGVSASSCNYNMAEHNQINKDIILKFMKWNVPFILYWEMYNNEVKDGKQVGFWLIDDKNVKWDLYYTIKGFQTL